MAISSIARIEGRHASLRKLPEVLERPACYLSHAALEGGERDFDEREGTPEFQLRDDEKTGDPVRRYLREMGTAPLLDRDSEVEIARRIEHGEWLVYEALYENPPEVGHFPNVGLGHFPSVATTLVQPTP